jgi:hypothetical protein
MVVGLRVYCQTGKMRMRRCFRKLCERRGLVFNVCVGSALARDTIRYSLPLHLNCASNHSIWPTLWSYISAPPFTMVTPGLPIFGLAVILRPLAADASQ